MREEIILNNKETADDFIMITDLSVIKDSLNRILNSPEFKESNRSKQLLKYIVEKHLEGNADQINGTTIAQDVLGTGADFDSSTNPIVRVQAGRLRKLLSKYYRRSGQSDNVIVYVAKGQYAPQFGTRKELRPIIEASKSTRSWSPQSIAKLGIISLASIIILISLFFGVTNTLKSKQINIAKNGNTNTYPSIAIHPFKNLTNDPKNDVFEQGFQHQFGTDLSRFSVIRVVYSNLRYEQMVAEEKPVADYLLEGTLLSVKNEIDLLIKLVNLKTGKTTSQHRIKRKIGDDSYFNALVDVSTNLSQQYAELGGTLGKESLADLKLYLDMTNHRHANLKAFECLSLFHKFELVKSVENFNHAAGCLNYQVSQNKTDATLLAALAWVSVYGSSEMGLLKDYPIMGDYSLSKALNLAEQAIALDPGNSIAYQYLALIQWRSGQHEAAIQSIRRSIQLNPAATGNLINLGHFLSFTGDWKNGLKATNDALAQNPNAPYWFYTPLYFRAVLDRNTSDVMVFAKKHNDSRSSDGGVYVLIAASISGDTAMMEKYIPIVKTYAANNGDDPLYVTRRWVQSPEIIKALEAELKAVGIAVSTN